MNNWTVVFIIIGVLVLASIVAGAIFTSKAMNKVGGLIEDSGNNASNGIITDEFGNVIS